ncbi:MAG TPA: sugar kinase [Verrucomicrobiae bacterium]|nr:sugar kinase [Verrucomicrobiae bacterium]
MTDEGAASAPDRGSDVRDIDILVIGEINPDIVVADADPVPVFGEVERVVGSIVMTVGSSSAIFACGAARLGLRVAFVGVVGDDAFGRFMLDAMAERGVDVTACTVDPTRPTGATVILSSGRDRAILTALGTIGALDVDRVPDALLARSRHLHLSCFYLQETSRARLPGFFAAARARGLSTSFDTNWDPTERWAGGVLDLLRTSDVFLPNEAEATRIAGVADPEAAAHLLSTGAAGGRADGGPIVVVKRGASGALACRGDDTAVRVSAMPVGPIDTTGAGDSFNAGFLRAWLNGGDIPESLEFAAACGALSTRRYGGVDGQPTFAEATAAVEAWRSIRGRSP